QPTLTDDLVDDVLPDERVEQARGRGNQQADQPHGNRPPVRLQVAEDAEEDVHGGSSVQAFRPKGYAGIRGFRYSGGRTDAVRSDPWAACLDGLFAGEPDESFARRSCRGGGFAGWN